MHGCCVEFLPHSQTCLHALVVSDPTFSQERNSYVLDIDRACPNRAVETVQHLFFHCPISFAVWAYIKIWLDILRSMSMIPSALK